MKHESFDLSAHNAQIFFSDQLADWYSAQTLCPAETMILLRHRDAFKNKRVLDLGVGSGRTTRFLQPFAETYVGVDFSPQMLARCKRDFPAATLYEMDIRELGKLADDRFDFVMASWAVLDALAPDDRLKALSRIATMTKSGGVFVLSAHNRDAAIAGKPPAMAWTKRPDRLAREAAHYAIARRNYARMKHMRRDEADHALYNDMAHRWQGVFYYISRAAQTAQLEKLGFDVREVIGEDGRTIRPSGDTSPDGCLHFVAVKR
jgi:SAM-dependent methyltransferase